MYKAFAVALSAKAREATSRTSSLFAKKRRQLAQGCSTRSALDHDAGGPHRP